MVRWPVLLLIAAVFPLPAASHDSFFRLEDHANIEVTVSVQGVPLADAVVALDLDRNGFWDEHLNEPRDTTDIGGRVFFNGIVSIQDPMDDDPGEVFDWRPSRILSGNLRGAFDSRDVRFDFVLPPGVGSARLGLYDLRGRCLGRADGAGDLVLNVPGGLPPGVYFVRLSAGGLAPVSHRVTSAGIRARSVMARRVSVAEAVGAGWAEPGPAPGGGKSRDDGHPATLLVSHVQYGGVNQDVTIMVGDGQTNIFTVNLPQPPAGFVYLSPGRFLMGSPDNEHGRETTEGPQHLVNLTKGLLMFQYEVTEEFWYQVMGSPWADSQMPKRASWYEAVQFCNRLTQLHGGLQYAYTIHHDGSGRVTWHRNANGFRLPTEAEWEYACRATSAYAYNNGTNCLSSDDEANFRGDIDQLPGCPEGDYRGMRWEVGFYPPNARGLYDMHGNLFEWVWCGLRTYSDSMQVDPAFDVEPGTPRVMRGGYWEYEAQYCRSASRNYTSPGHEFVRVGFRPVRSWTP